MGADVMHEDWSRYGGIHPKMQKVQPRYCLVRAYAHRRQLLDDGAYAPDFSRNATTMRKEFDPEQPSDIPAGIEEHDIEIPARN